MRGLKGIKSMARYKLLLKHKDPEYYISIICANAEEALQYKRKATRQGYEVEVKRLHEEENTKKV